ncbi:MAG: lipid-A-disaccharide synthase N-terminal domain-containing protein [Candidatus Omnitrophica bacterium]|nr:lipid-A-disaccharide synthase N-terminal domain-containing protein [Candidatus Omnitrophota bacterium]
MAFDNMNGWVIFGLFGQVLFSLRFIVQWIFSEKEKRSYIPTIFWYISLAGGAVLFIYAVKKNDIVFIIGQGSGLIVYIRNIVLINRNKAAFVHNR